MVVGPFYLWLISVLFSIMEFDDSGYQHFGTHTFSGHSQKQKNIKQVIGIFSDSKKYLYHNTGGFFTYIPLAVGNSKMLNLPIQTRIPIDIKFPLVMFS